MTEPLPRYRNIVFDSARWEGFRYRGDDVVVVSPPKSGTTWIQMMCALLIFQDPILPGRLTDLSPWIDIMTAPLAEVVATLEAQDHRRIIKTHTPLDGIPFDQRVTYICVGRDPRDAALSWDHHIGNSNFEVILAARAQAVGLDDLAEIMPDGPPPQIDDPVERFWQWVEEDFSPEGRPSGLGATIHTMSTFWAKRHLDNVALFHFADLEADLDAEMRRLAGILRIEVDEGKWPSLVAAATFDHMKARADDLAPQVKVAGFWHDNAQFFHAGQSGQWRTLISDQELPRYQARLRQLAGPDLAVWAEGGWRACSSDVPDPPGPVHG